MKKTVFCILLVIATLFMSILPASADETNPSTIQNEDGSTVTIFEDGSMLTVSAAYGDDEPINARATTLTVTKHKIASYSNADGELQWEFTLTATFSYIVGLSSTCTSASYSKSIEGSGWSFSDGSATKSGSTATGKGTFTKKMLFITTRTDNVNISLTCDKYGEVT